jgi:DNA polymerase
VSKPQSGRTRQFIVRLNQSSHSQVTTMPVKASLQLDSHSAPRVNTLSALREAEAACTRCPLYKGATQVVPGEGRLHARLMLIGEQPGDREDLAGKPFVGPAGRILDEALEAAGIDREAVFVTNAVKHFKHEMRGKRRLHKKPNAYEIERCKWWLEQERAIVKPQVLVALGATGARSVFGRAVTVAKMRGTPHRLADGAIAFVTIHPSWLLRIKDEADKDRERRNFVADLRRAGELIAAKAA